MEVRKFKPGDRVMEKSGEEIMEVVKYVTEHDPLVGDRFSEHTVECVWFDDENTRHKELFDQRTLTKVENNKGLFAT